MEKVKVTRKQAELLNHFLTIHGSKYEMVYVMHTDPEPWGNALDKLTGEEITNALYYGYDVEETQEDKVRKLYIEQKQSESDDQLRTEVAIKDVLNLLNIKIEGVNV